MVNTRAKNVTKVPDKHTKRLLLYLFTGTKGGYTRLRIVMALANKPSNTHQLARELNLDYKAVQHHMKVLEKNSLIKKIGKQYGAIFYLSDFLEINIRAFDDIIAKLDRKLNQKKVYY